MFQNLIFLAWKSKKISTYNKQNKTTRQAHKLYKVFKKRKLSN
jgi:hypothetical protein